MRAVGSSGGKKKNSKPERKRIKGKLKAANVFRSRKLDRLEWSSQCRKLAHVSQINVNLGFHHRTEQEKKIEASKAL